MSKQNTNENKQKYGNLGFYLVIALCAAMIGVSCWFAYTQTADNLSIQLDSALDSANDLAAEQRMAATTPVMTTARAAAYVPAATAAAIETKPEAPASTAASAQTTTETVTQTAAPLHCAAPLEGEILAAFSNGELVKSPTTGVWQTHNGVDIAASLGDEVRAMADGVVDAVEEDPLWGVCVTIDHQNGVKSRYCNLNAGLSVNTGDKVTCGMVIGAVGETADIESAMDAHLHFEVLRGDVYVDPAEVLESEAE